MTTPDPAWSREDYDAAEQALREAEARVAQLRAKLAAELTGQDAHGISAEGRPHRLGWADGVAEARARYPKGRGTGDAPDPAPDEAAEQTLGSAAAAGRDEARRRAARRA
jgi:hypothetical protein